MRLEGPTYYEVLGVSPVASTDEIKKRYRELARVHHPDVAKLPNALEKFKQINEANGVLSNPDSRSRYDSELALRAHRHAPLNPFQTAPSTNPHAGRNSTSPSSSASAPKPTQQRKTGGDDFAKMVLDAQTAFAKMRYRDAEQIARQALRLYRRDAALYELLGDIEVKRGRTDEAVAYYSYALQLERMRPGLQRKFDKLTGEPYRPTMSGSAARAARNRAHAQHRTFYSDSTGKFGLVIFMILGFVGFLTCSWLLYYLITTK